MSYYANKGNKQIPIQEHEIDLFAAEGYVVVNEKGKRFGANKNSDTIPLAEHRKILKEAQSKEGTAKLQELLDGANKHIDDLEAELERHRTPTA